MIVPLRVFAHDSAAPWERSPVILRRVRRGARRMAAACRIGIPAAVSNTSVGSGLRAATAITVPLLLAVACEAPLLSWTSFGGFLVSLGDPGGSDRTRTLGALGLTVTSTALVAIAAIAGTHPLVAGTAMLACAIAGALAARRSSATGLLGMLATEAFIVSVAAPAASPAAAVMRSLAFGAGGLWAMLLLIVVWPFRTAAPATTASAAVFSALAGYSRALADAAQQPRARRRWRRIALDEPARIRVRLAASAALVAEQMRTGPSVTAERLTPLQSAAEGVFAAQLAFAHELDPATAGAVPLSGPLVASIEQSAKRLHDIAAALRGGTAVPVRVSEEAERPSSPSQASIVARRLAACVDEAEHVARESPASIAVLAITGTHAIPRIARPAAQRGAGHTRIATVSRLRAAWADPHVRHAARLGTLTAGVVCASGVLGVERPQWLAVTILFILHPDSAFTRARARDRVLGTALGALLISVAAEISSTLGLPFAVFAFAFTGVAALGVSYTAFSVFLTPLAVLLADPALGNTGSGGIVELGHVAAVRVANTVLGGGLALVAVRWLWPSADHDHARAVLAQAIEATRDYLHAALVALPSTSGPELVEARRRAGAAMAAAEQRLSLVRGKEPGAAVEAMATLLERLQHLALSVSAVAAASDTAAPVSSHGAPPSRSDDAWRAAVAAWFLLHQAEEAVRMGRGLDLNGSIGSDALQTSMPHLFAHLAGVAAAVNAGAHAMPYARTPRAA